MYNDNSIFTVLVIRQITYCLSYVIEIRVHQYNYLIILYTEVE